MLKKISALMLVTLAMLFAGVVSANSGGSGVFVYNNGGTSGYFNGSGSIEGVNLNSGSALANSHTGFTSANIASDQLVVVDGRDGGAISGADTAANANQSGQAATAGSSANTFTGSSVFNGAAITSTKALVGSFAYSAFKHHH